MKNKNDLLISLSSEIADLRSKVDKLTSFMYSDDFKMLEHLDCEFLYLQRRLMLMCLEVLRFRSERLLNE